MAATPAQCGPDPLQCTEAEDSLEAAFGLEAKYARAAGSPAAWPCDDSDDSNADECDLPDVQLPACDQAAGLEAALRSEGEVQVDCAYLQRQPAVDASVRTRLVEWVLLVRAARRAAAAGLVPAQAGPGSLPPGVLTVLHTRRRAGTASPCAPAAWRCTSWTASCPPTRSRRVRSRSPRRRPVVG